MTAPILEIKDLQVHFRRRRLNPLAQPEVVRAVDRVSLTLNRGQTLGLVGESGSGKTTVATGLIAGLAAGADHCGQHRTG